MSKSKHIISETNGFFHKNENNRVINGIMRTIEYLNLRSSSLGVEKRHNRNRHRQSVEEGKIRQVQPQVELLLCLYGCRIHQSGNPYILL